MITISLSIIFLLIKIILAASFLFLLLAFFTGAPFVPANKKIIPELMNLAKIEPGVIVYDLGSGDGRILIEAAKRKAFAFGWEINPILVLFSKIKIFLSGQSKRTKVSWGNFWSIDLKKADVIIFYLISHWMKKMEKKILKEAKSQAKIISYIYRFPNLKAKTKTKSGIYVYEINNRSRIVS